MSFTIIKKGSPVPGEYEIEGEITAEEVAKFRAEALATIGADLKMDGFRPGKVPEKILVERLGEVAIIEEAGRIALEKHYEEIVTSVKIKPIGSPAVTITKVAPGEAFGFKIKTALLPEIEIADYKKIAKKEMSASVEVTVEDKEIEDAIKELQQQVAHTEHHQKNPEDHSHDHGDLALPEVNEEFISKFGAFESVEDFKKKIGISIKAEKEKKEKDKKRILTVDAIIEKSTITMPHILVESELNRMLGELSSQVSQMGLNVDMYLKHINKTLEDLKKEWTPEAEKRAKSQIILNDIAVKENITVTDEEVKKEVDAILNYYKDADPMKATVYVETMLTNEKVWKFLEEVK
ncbi:MAG: hypothetical protein RL094_158 [Candidatus Parcubacteria bacterium]|jgi:FKBP-type peptidyl-prolyl cis-trans isomerase (trigger factor)